MAWLGTIFGVVIVTVIRTDAYHPRQLNTREVISRIRRQAGPPWGPPPNLPSHAGGGIAAQWNQSSYGQPGSYMSSPSVGYNYNAPPQQQQGPASLGRPLFYGDGSYSGYHHVVDQQGPTHVVESLVPQPAYRAPAPVYALPQPMLYPSLNQSYTGYAAPPLSYPQPLSYPASPAILPPSYSYEGVGQPRVYGYGLQAPPIGGGGAMCYSAYGLVPCQYSLPNAAYPKKKKYGKKTQMLFDADGNPVDPSDGDYGYPGSGYPGPYGDGSYGPMAPTTPASTNSTSTGASGVSSTSPTGASGVSSTSSAQISTSAAAGGSVVGSTL